MWLHTCSKELHSSYHTHTHTHTHTHAHTYTHTHTHTHTHTQTNTYTHTHTHTLTHTYTHTHTHTHTLTHMRAHTHSSCASSPKIQHGSDDPRDDGGYLIRASNWVHGSNNTGEQRQLKACQLCIHAYRACASSRTQDKIQSKLTNLQPKSPNFTVKLILMLINAVFIYFLKLMSQHFSKWLSQAPCIQ